MNVKTENFELVSFWNNLYYKINLIKGLKQGWKQLVHFITRIPSFIFLKTWCPFWFIGTLVILVIKYFNYYFSFHFYFHSFIGKHSCIITYGKSIVILIFIYIDINILFMQIHILEREKQRDRKTQRDRKYEFQQLDGGWQVGNMLTSLAAWKFREKLTFQSWVCNLQAGNRYGLYVQGWGKIASFENRSFCF